MAYMRVYCDVCGGTWEVYQRQAREDSARQCPHCYAKINRNIWKKKVLPAFVAVQEINVELYKDHASNHTPLFTVDIVADHLYKSYQTRHENAGSCPVKEVLDSV